MKVGPLEVPTFAPATKRIRPNSESSVFRPCKAGVSSVFPRMFRKRGVQRSGPLAVL